jgi:iron complex outermembrane receptor protein
VRKPALVRTVRTALAASAALLAIVPLSAPAQESESDPAEAEAETEAEASDSGPTENIEEIEVVGELTEGLGSDEATSSTLFRADELEALGVEDVSDVSLFTPNLEIRQAGSTTATFFIRGVGLQDFSANAAGAVAVYLDDVPMNSPPLQLTPVFDVEGVSVLRGPQGTGAGRNASAGALKISSRKPNFESSSNFSFNLGSVVSDDAKDAFRQEYLGAVEMPVVEDVLGGRFSFVYRANDPYIQNGCGNAPPLEQRLDDNGVAEPFCGERKSTGFFQVPPVAAGLDKWLGDETTWAARGILRLVPPDSDVDVLLIGRGSRLDNDSTVGQAAAANRTLPFIGGNQSTSALYQEPDQKAEFDGLFEMFRAQTATDGEARLLASEVFTKKFIDRLDDNPYRGDYNRVGTTTLDMWGAALDMAWEGDDARIRSISAYDTWERSVDADTDFTPDVLFEADGNEDEAWQFAQELGIQGELAEYPLVWDFGGNVLVESVEGGIHLQTQSQNPFGFPTIRDYDQDLLGWLVYGGFSLDFWDDYFTLDAGLRYNWEKKEFKITQENRPPTPVNSDDDDAIWQEPTYTVGITYRPSDWLRIYWKYTHGFKAGHFNTNRVGTLDNPASPADAETIDAFEVGFSGSAWDYRVRASGALFHYDYDNYQVFNIESEPLRTPVLEIINANDAENYGGEVELLINPLRGFVPREVEGLEIVLRGGWLNTEYLDFTDEQTDLQDGKRTEILADFSGNQLINAPELSFSGSLAWTLDLGDFGYLTPRWDFAWTDDTPFDASESRGQLDVNGETSKPKGSIGQPDFWLHNVRLDLRSADDRFGIGAWCRNVLDQRYRTFAFDASRFGKLIINFVGDPRTCGAGASFRF